LHLFLAIKIQGQAHHISVIFSAAFMGQPRVIRFKNETYENATQNNFSVLVSAGATSASSYDLSPLASFFIFV